MNGPMTDISEKKKHRARESSAGEGQAAKPASLDWISGIHLVERKLTPKLSSVSTCAVA